MCVCFRFSVRARVEPFAQSTARFVDMVFPWASKTFEGAFGWEGGLPLTRRLT